VRLAQSVTLQSLGVPPYNPFLIVNQERKREIHLSASGPPRWP